MSNYELRLLRLPAVISTIGMSRSWIYKKVAGGEFPPPVKVGGASLWRSSDIDAWIDKISSVQVATHRRS